MAKNINDYKMAYDVFRDFALLAGFDNDTLITDLYSGSQRYLNAGIDAGQALELLAVAPDAPQSYKDFLTNFNKIKQATPLITTVGDYLTARRQYKQTLSSYGLQDIATDESADAFLQAGVSPQEASDRVDFAFKSIFNADDELKKQLTTFYPSLKTSDLVKSVLGVGQTVEQLQKTVNMAGIAAGAARSNLTVQSDLAELERSGVNRAKAAAGFNVVSQGLQSVGAAAARAGTSVEGLQKELEAEQFLGMASQRRKKLAAREQAALSGQSGTMTGSLSRQVSGSI
jgi:hypothetical protein